MTTRDPDVEAASKVLLAAHIGQHRCEDGTYYGVHDWTACPTQTAHGVLLAAITRHQTAPHTAAHTPAAVDAVAVGMTGFDLAVLAEEDREGWRLTARYAIEALAAHLDGVDR
jgi:hypothetical protein